MILPIFLDKMNRISETVFAYTTHPPCLRASVRTPEKLPIFRIQSALPNTQRQL